MAVPSAGRTLWQTLSSTKTGVVLLILVVIVSAAGTVILQRPATDPQDLQRAYSPQMLRVLDLLGLTDVFHTWWFILLLLLVSVTIVAASIERFPNSWRYFSRPYKSSDDTFRRVLATQKQIPIRDQEHGLIAAERVLRHRGLSPEWVHRNDQVSLFAERNRFSEMAVYIVHASLLLVFFGGIVDGLFGWRGSITLIPGQQSPQVELSDQAAARTLPFTIRCDGAGQENYSDGTPRKWWSKLVVLQNGQEVARKEIVVNDPLVYQGIRFYQSGYGPTGKIANLIVSATQSEGKASAQEIDLATEQPIQLDPDTTVRLAEFIPDYVVSDGQVYTRSSQVENPAAHLIVESHKAGKSVNFWIPPIPGFEQNSSSPYQFEVKNLQMAFFTGLQVSHEPGQWAVWGGVILMGFGLAMVFYVVHARYWVVPIQDSRGRLFLWVGGAANRNKDVFEQTFRKLVEQIQTEVRQLEESGWRVPEPEEAEMVGAGAPARRI